ncbi:MAG: neutral/alkaline non-lysosomal ceramidase N-terminal domain-containing protein [Ginsengibacter sp.]
MKKTFFISFIYVLTILAFLDAGATKGIRKDYHGWKAGVARVIITPDHPLWMAGYASRDHPAEGTLNDLWAKALALEDATGNRAVLVTMDLVGIPKGFSDRLRARLKTRFHLSAAQVILNSSHTHSGPVLEDALVDIYPLDSLEIIKIKKYTGQLEDKITRLVGEALHSLKPAQLYSKNGIARFQVNRRNNIEAILNSQTQLNGPNDYAVPIIKVTGKSGNIIAIAFGYACHNTVLNGYKWSGDYAGFAQLELEKKYPAAIALFFQCCGADQNPLPRRTVPLAQQYGQTLAAAVERVLNENMEELTPHLITSYKEIDLSLTAPPTKDKLLKTARDSTGYQKRWAARLLKQLDQGDSFRTSYPYPLQVWRLGNQTMMILGGEVVIEYAVQLKRIFGEDIFVLGYSNDVMAYIPSATILGEGGYEGATSQMVYGLPATWALNIETLIISQMVLLAEQAGILKPELKLIKN